MKRIQRPSKLSEAIYRKVLSRITDPLFLFKAGQKIGELGVEGEERTRLITFLAGVSRTLPEPASVLIKGWFVNFKDMWNKLL